jgi:hypothetical protein
VQVQLEQQQHLKKCFVARESSRDRSPSPVPSGDNVPAAPSRPPPPSNAVVPQQGGAAVQRHAMIVSLYEELQRLEDGLLCSATVVAAAARVRSSPARQRSSSKHAEPRRARSRQPIAGRRVQDERKGTLCNFIACSKCS